MRAFQLNASLSVVAIAVLSACGGGSGTEGPSPTTQAPQPAPIQPAPAVPSTPAPSPSAPPVVAAADPGLDVDRLRALGYQVFVTEGEPPAPTPEPELLIVELDPASPPASSEAASLGRRSAAAVKPQIVGGTGARPNQFPWVAQLFAGNSYCSGSLIAPNWIITAKHCDPTASVSGISAIIGSVENGVFLPAATGEHIVVDYYVKLSTDVSLYHLATPSAITPIAYNSISSLDGILPLRAIGFGRDSATSSMYPNLKFADSTKVAFGADGYLNIGVENSMNTVCYGDSGGPSITYTSLGYPLLIGVTSGTFYPYCTGIYSSAQTAYLASNIEQTVGVPPMQFPISNAVPQIGAIGQVETALGDTTFTVPVVDSDSSPLIFTSKGLPRGLSINPSTGVVTGTTTAFSYDAPNVVTISVADAKSGASRSVTFPWRVNTPGNANPVISPISDVSARPATTVSPLVQASDPNGDTLQFTATGLPPGIALSSAGVFSGSPTSGGSYQVNVRAVDNKGGFALSSFIWTVQNSNPVLPVYADQTDAVGSPQSLTLSAVDPDGDVLTFSATGLPTGLAIDAATGVITGVTKAAGTYFPRVAVTDRFGGQAARGFIWAVSNGFNHPPAFAAIPDQVTPPGTAVNLPLTVSDSDGHKISLSFLGLPTGVTFNAATMALTGYPTRGGTFKVTASAFDAYGGRTVLPVINWEVPNRPPVVTAPDNKTIQPGTGTSIPITSSDPDGHSYTIVATGLPKGLAYNAATRAVSGTVQQSGQFAVTLTATDKYMAKGSASFTIGVPNQAPVIRTQLPSRVFLAGAAVSEPIDAYDPDGHALRIALSTSPTSVPVSLPPGLSINAVTKVVSGKPVRPGSYNVRLDVSDVYGAKTTGGIAQWVVTNLSPQLSSVADQASSMGTPISPLQLPGTDPDGHALTYTVKSLPAGLRVSAAGLITGTPTVKSSYVVSVQAKDSYGGISESRTFNWIIN